MKGKKKCFRCEKWKSRDEFYKHSQMADGLLGKCISCTKADATAFRTANLEKVRAYDRERGKLPHRLAKCREYAATHTEELRTYKREYAKRPHAKKARYISTKKYRAKYPERRAAHVLLGHAVRDGRIEKPKHCSACNGLGVIHGHHKDYCKPLEVDWLCSACHNELHREI